jgi:hypothetical protein
MIHTSLNNLVGSSPPSIMEYEPMHRHTIARVPPHEKLSVNMGGTIQKVLRIQPSPGSKANRVNAFRAVLTPSFSWLVYTTISLSECYSRQRATLLRNTPLRYTTHLKHWAPAHRLLFIIVILTLPILFIC